MSLDLFIIHFYDSSDESWPLLLKNTNFPLKKNCLICKTVLKISSSDDFKKLIAVR